MLSYYARFVARWPWINLIVVILVVVVSGLLAFFLVDEDHRPDFAEPTEGFETRGTTISGAVRTWTKLYDEVLDRELVRWPPVTLPPDDNNNWEPVTQSLDGDTQAENTTAADVGGATAGRMPNSTEGMDTTTSDNSRKRRKKRSKVGDLIGGNVNIDGCYHDPDGEPKIIFKGKNGQSLLSAAAMKEICEIDQRYLSSWHTDDYKRACPGLSLGSLVASLTQKKCEEITDVDVEELSDLLRSCAPSYLECGENCVSVSPNCNAPLYNAAYTIFYYLTDANFAKQLADAGADETVKPTFTVLVGYGFWTYTEVLDVYMDSLDHATSKKFRTVSLEGIDIGDNKFDLFNEYLLDDIVYFVLAMALILIVMCVYLRSLAITVATVFNVLFSFVFAYFFYYVVCRFKYFPFLNILSGLILIAVGADDVFIFVDVWQQEYSKVLKGGETVKLSDCLYRTLRHALMSIFVTSLTTASAFFANIVSDITAVRCFGIFSGLAILANFVLMVTWVPAVIVLLEKTNRYCCKCCSMEGKPDDGCLAKVKRVMDIPLAGFKYVFSHALPLVVSKAWFVWLSLFTIIGMAGVVLVFIKPKLELPSSDSFQLFPSDHPIERYDMSLKRQFSFNDKTNDDWSNEAIIVWGIEGKDNGDHYNPDDYGHVEYDKSFDLSTPEAQVWLQDFCSSLTNASFLAENYRELECLLQKFFALQPQECAVFPEEYHECCNHNGQPVSSETFKKCFPAFLAFYYNQYGYGNTLDMVLFNSQGEIAAYAFNFKTNQPFETGYTIMKDYYGTMEDFMEDARATAPPEVRGFWFAGNFDFYDLQRALSSGTYIAIGVSLGVALLVMFLTSLNVLLSFYAIVNIGFSISVTVGILVLLGWELNVLESVAISISVGLSIDFAIHYSVGYRLCEDPNQPARVKESLTRVGPAIAMAALTTFLAGAAIMGTRILAYIQLGTFLMLVMVVSWLFATFFFLPLCSIAGPKGNFAQISCPSCCGGRTSTSTSPAPAVSEASKL